jgi:hypothetical protein
MSGYQNRLLDPFADSDASSTGIAPGKRTLTQSLPGAPASLRGQEREVVDFDSAVGDDVYDARATIDAPAMTSSRLSDAQLRKARRRNQHWQARLGFSPSLFGGGDVATGEFADNVADKQAALGLPVDGIAGPQTIEAVAAAARPDPLEATRGRRDADGAAHRASAAGIDRADDGDFYDARATVDTGAASRVAGDTGRGAGRFAGDDPFAMHLIGSGSSS